MSTTLDRAGRQRREGWKPAKPPANKGKRYDPHPPSGADILQAIGTLSDSPQDLRLAALIAVLWRGGLGLTEALNLVVDDCDSESGFITVRTWRYAARRKAAMDQWGFERLERWKDVRCELPDGPLFCILRGPTVGQDWRPVGARAEVRRLGKESGIVRFTPQQLRYAHAVELLETGISPAQAYRQLGISTARNNRLAAFMRASNSRAPSLRAPGAEKVIHRVKNAPPGEAYSLIRRAAQAADEAHQQASTRSARRAYDKALRALHEAEDNVLHAVAEDGQ
jgi:integrase